MFIGIVGFFAACHSSGGSGTPDGGSSVPCPGNVGSTSGGAVTLKSPQTLQNKLCYEGTSNWYVISVPAGSTLLDITAGYPATSDTPVQLAVTVYFETNSTTLTQLAQLIADNSSDAGSSDIQTTIHAVEPGSYYIQLADAHNVNFDMTNAYTLTVDYAVDPDSHEPNDTTALAKVSDSKPGWLAYLNDLDIFKTTVTSAEELITLDITNPSTASAPINYTITSASSTTPLTQDQAPPSNSPTTTRIPAPAAGTYYVTLSYPAGAIPSHAPSSAYSLTFTSVANPDTLDNHTIATAACPGGGPAGGPCNTAFSGTQVNLPTEMSYITVNGQRDFYRIDVASGAAAVLDIELTSSASTPVKYAIDLLTPDPNSTCTADTDCVAMKQQCTSNIDDAGITVTTDCELSHACLPLGNYKFCPSSAPCQLCTGAGICIPPGTAGASGVCAVPQYLSDFSPKGTLVAGPTVSTAQPLFSNQPYFINVHDVSYNHTDVTNPYSLTLTIAPELDANDQSTVAADRNNFYNPYPSAADNLDPNKARAVNITEDLKNGTTVTAWISYETDNDWYYFEHPCPGMDCALDFTWLQPGPSPVTVAFYMLNNDLSLHESFGYDGNPKNLTMPMTSSFDNAGGSCDQCSFAARNVTTADASPPYVYYLRVAADPQTTWDYSSGGQYQVTVKKGMNGCPASCSYPGDGGCYCWCTSTMSCPASKF
jgi:hypothetical protein